MSAEQDHVTVGEFSRAVASIERQMASGFRGIHKRLDTVSEDIQTNGERLAGVEAVQADCAGTNERVAALEALQAGGDKATKKSALTWGGVTAGGVTGLFWFLDMLHKYFKGGN